MFLTADLNVRVSVPFRAQKSGYIDIGRFCWAKLYYILWKEDPWMLITKEIIRKMFWKNNTEKYTEGLGY